MHLPNISLLEIGVQDGNSLGLWQRLFPQARSEVELSASSCFDFFALTPITVQHGRIAAIGYGHGSKAGAMRRAGAGVGQDGGHGLRLYYGDQSNVTFLRSVEADLGLGPGGDGQKFSVIIDDGSHVPWHQIFTFEVIFERWLAEGGIYIIEVAHTR